jgi:hypothetical protein
MEEAPDCPSAPGIKFETAQQRYRKTDKCKAARQRYYDTKGREKAHEYYLKNREKILNRSKERYESLKTKDDLGK